MENRRSCTNLKDMCSSKGQKVKATSSVGVDYSIKFPNRIMKDKHGIKYFKMTLFMSECFCKHLEEKGSFPYFCAKMSCLLLLHNL